MAKKRRSSSLAVMLVTLAVACGTVHAPEGDLVWAAAAGGPERL